MIGTDPRRKAPPLSPIPDERRNEAMFAPDGVAVPMGARSQAAVVPNAKPERRHHLHVAASADRAQSRGTILRYSLGEARPSIAAAASADNACDSAKAGTSECVMVHAIGQRRFDEAAAKRPVAVPTPGRTSAPGKAYTNDDATRDTVRSKVERLHSPHRRANGLRRRFRAAALASAHKGG